ncbi:thiamine biosynthesis lipoprotein [Lewinella aquimaris]|uniref:FAD:protein FMN transferase n=1 Tax=Neolewinella aquimaris TaxID=1835722 RepID=A0A840EFK7_9BACT|nr:FAD:protein FMN transferase [Neolewinella aquimaris]MBB4080589.1 thiamine biosynthesis lipoprotein [Neolewinella aquimaris]
MQFVRRVSLSFAVFLLALSLPLPAQHRLSVSRPAMGTPWSITVYADDTSSAHRIIDSAYARIEAVEQAMSDYRTDSEINRLARLPPRRYHRVSGDLYRILKLSRQLARRSRGAFDPTVGPLSRLWRRAIRSQTFPSEQEISRAGSRVQWKYLRLRRPNLVWLARDSMQLDLGGIAKGYALDAAGEVLRTGGLPSFLVDGGGDLLLGASPPDRSGWRIKGPNGPIDTAFVAVATSGTAYKYVEHEGNRYSHLIDPRTGMGVVGVRSVSVFAPSGTLADALASALLVTDPRKEPKWLKKYASVRYYRKRRED